MNTMESSTTDFTKFILKALIKQISEILKKHNSFIEEATKTNYGGRVQFLRAKANGTNKLKCDDLMEGFAELVRKNNENYLKDPKWKVYEIFIRTAFVPLSDSQGYVDLTDGFGTSAFFQSLTFNDKMKLIFNTIDENGDGFLSKQELEKFFFQYYAKEFSVYAKRQFKKRRRIWSNS